MNLVRRPSRTDHTARMRISPRLASSLALAGLFVVLGLLAGYSVWSNVRAGQQLDEVDRAIRLSNAYRDATEGLAEGEIHILRYLLGGPAAPEEFWTIRSGIGAALEIVAKEGDVRDLLAVMNVEQVGADHLAGMERFFAGAAAGEPNTADLPDPSMPTQTKAALRGPASASQADAAAALAGLVDRQASGLITTLGVFAVGALLIVACLAFIRRSARQNLLAQVELRNLRHVAQTDPLTGLGNQRAFEEHLEIAVAQAAADSQPVALAIVDVDEFKRVNDTWGHDRGDEVLRTLAAILWEQSRAGDAAFRLGGDEFALIMPRTSVAEASRVTERLREQVATRVHGVTVSMGLSAITASESDLRLLRAQADSALYDAKARGRNLVLPFDLKHSRVPVFQSSKVDACHSLLARTSVDIVFQPIWGMGDGQLLAVEALMRPPAESRLAPLEAFQIAERIGRTHELDALCQESILARAGELPPGILLFVNISPHTLDHPAFSAAALASRAARAGLSPSRIVLEMTERSDVPVDRLVSVVEELRAIGFRFALDDVGSGTQGFDVLRRLPVDYVKIARAVVAGAGRDRPGRAALMAIIAFATEAGARVVAEGVDQQQMLDLIRGLAHDDGERPSLEVYAVQGYLLGRPDPFMPGTLQADLASQPAA